MKNNGYRHELKYLIDETQQALMRLKMRHLLEPDSHAENGRYLIRSLYFDDLWNSAHSEKEDGILLRKKYRIRIYNYSDQVILFLIEKTEQLLENQIFDRMESIELVVGNTGINGIHKEIQ